MDDSTRYLRIYLVGAIPLLTYNLFQGTLQGVGGLGWKVAGAAWACVLSMCTCTGLALRHFLTTDGAHRFSFSKIRVDMPSLKRMMRIGLPSGFQSSLYSVSNIIIQAALNGLNDTPLITAWTATGRLDGFYWVTTSAFGVAICAFAGQCYGAGKYERLKQAMKVCMGISLAVTAALSVTLLSVARPVYRLFVEHETTIDKAIEIMWCFVPFYVLWSYIEVMTGTLRGMGDTFEPMIITLIGTCLFRVLWMTLLVPVWPTIPGISLVYPVSWLITGTAFTVYFLRKLRRGII